MRSLVVDDDNTCRTVYQLQLSKYGECDTAASGIEGINAYSASIDNGRPYDVIVLDIMMPDIPGDLALNNIRNLENSKGIDGDRRTKVILVTALDDDVNRKIKDYLDETLEAYLPKSANGIGLVRKIQEMGVSLDY